MCLTTTDKQDIKGMISEGIEKSPVINDIKDNLHNLEGRFDGLDGRFDGLEVRFDGLEGRFDGLEVRFDRLEDRFDGLENRFDGLDGGFVGLNTRVYRVEVLLEDTYSTVKHVIEMISDNLKVKSHVDNHEARLTDVETKQPIIISTLALHSKQLKTL